MRSGFIELIYYVHIFYVTDKKFRTRYLIKIVSEEERRK